MQHLIQRISPASWLLLSLLLIVGCSKDDPDTNGQITIEDYISQNSLSPTYTSTGLGYIIGEPGDSRRSVDESTVKTEVLVTSTADRLLIDTEGEIFINMLSQVPALQEGMKLIGEGGKIIVYAPFELAWGVAGNVSVPENSDVIIEISLTSILIDIEDYITENNIEAVDIPDSNVKVVIEVEGDGSFPDEDSVVNVKYTGYLTNGDLFDESTDGLSISLQNVILGWQEGIPAFSKGGKGMLFIPYEEAYGTTGNTAIPGRTDLIFDIELVDFN